MENLNLSSFVFALDEKKLYLRKMAGYSGALFGDWGRRLFQLRCDGITLDGRDMLCTEADLQGNTLRFRIEAEDGLEISSVWKYDRETEVISRRDTLHNTGSDTRIIERFFAVFPFNSGEYEGYWQRSLWCHENCGSWQTISHGGGVTLSSVSGRFCEGNTPFLVLRDNYAVSAVAFHLIPQGNWNIKLQQESACGVLPALFAALGQSDESMAHRLAPGEELAAPEILIQKLPDRSAAGGSGALHRYLLKNLPASSKPVPVLYNTWLDRYHHLEPERIRKQLAAAKRIGCEAFVVDYGWFEEHNYFLRIGRWQEKEGSAFEGNFAGFADEVRRAGLQFGLWIEAEFFHECTPEIAEHPEWFAPCRKDYWRLRLENPPAAAYFRDTIVEVIEKYRPAYIKNDMNHTQQLDDSGTELFAYTQALHKIWQELRSMYPEICFESCSSGGMRSGIDLLKDYDTFFISDNADSADTLRIAQGMLLRMLPGRCLHWMVSTAAEPQKFPGLTKDSIMVLQPQFATWDNVSAADLNFAMLAVMNGGIMGFSGDLAGQSEEVLNAIIPYVEFQKKYRESISRCSGWNLALRETAERLQTWMAFQYRDYETDRSFVYVFNMVRYGDNCRYFHLHEIAPDKEYRISKVFPVVSAFEENISGAALAEEGLRAEFRWEQQGGWRGALFVIESVR